MNHLTRSLFNTFVPFPPQSPKSKSPCEWPSPEQQDRSATLFSSESHTVICSDTTSPSSCTSSISPRPRKLSLESPWSLETVPSLSSTASSAPMTLKQVKYRPFRIPGCRGCSSGWSQTQRKGNGERRPPPRKRKNIYSPGQSHQRPRPQRYQNPHCRQPRQYKLSDHCHPRQGSPQEKLRSHDQTRPRQGCLASCRKDRLRCWRYCKGCSLGQPLTHYVPWSRMGHSQR